MGLTSIHYTVNEVVVVVLVVIVVMFLLVVIIVVLVVVDAAVSAPVVVDVDGRWCLWLPDDVVAVLVLVCSAGVSDLGYGD